MTEQNHSPQKTDTKKPLKAKPETMEKEIGGFSEKSLPEPTRFGDWEVGGRCSDF